jgi:Tol biopolymer transport system component
MTRTRIAVLSLAAAALTAWVGSIPASSASGPWRIFLSSNREGDSELYVVNANGSGARRLTRAPGVDAFAALSPDGRKIVYHSQDRRLGRPRGAVLINADGTGKRALPADGCPCSWSPDGRRIVFSSGRDGNGEIYIMNADGSGQRNLTSSPSSHEFGPAWSPDGRTIVFVTDRDSNQELYAMNADGSAQRNLTRHPLRDGEYGHGIRWSPDGRRIAFASNRDRNRGADGKVSDELYVMNADGSGQRRLTVSAEDETLLSWSPDSRRLAFQRFPAKPRWAFFVMNADGAGVRKLNWALPGRRR